MATEAGDNATLKRKAHQGRPVSLMRKTVIHALLLGVCLVFMAPFAWMISTSLKPKDQLMAPSPTLVPQQCEAQIDGAWVAVDREADDLDITCLLVRPVGTSYSQVILPDMLHEGYELLQTVDATPDRPWAKVRERLPGGEFGELRVVPVSELRYRAVPQWSNYKEVVRHDQMKFPLFMRNTLVIAALGVIGSLFGSSLAAYAFAKIKFRGRGVLFVVMLSTMMIPFPVLMVPMFSMFKWMGENQLGTWLGTFKPLWVPMWFGSAFNIFLLRQFFKTIPNELSEAARIDGCSELGIFLRIVLPLSRPALAVVALFTFMWVWNDFLGPLIYLQNQEQYTLVLGLQAYQSQHTGAEWHYLMATSVLIVLPIVVLFFIAQRTFIEGIATTGMKG